MPEDAFTVSPQVGNRKTGQTETVDALVGSGNALAIMPSSLLLAWESNPRERCTSVQNMADA